MRRKPLPVAEPERQRWVLTHAQAVSLTVFCHQYYNCDVTVAGQWLRA